MITRITKQTSNNSSHKIAHTMGEKSPRSYNSKLVSEIIYDPKNPLTLHLLLPFLQQLGTQPRWQLWLSPDSRMNRYLVNNLGLPTQKTMGLNKIPAEKSLEMMEKALRSGNFSTVITWLPAITPEIKERLYRAAIQGDSYCFILQPNSIVQDSVQWH